ncbi:hypothetical protein E0Z10_g4734 [Xylaria hypoxylon]|uniref:Fucose-specific lectin n=1 Tax=Xylaria hypoxylon TaxID=37992 RepID=A0A4Z0YXQ2_9PEZI|nr:hypothetical protein E0Z10_g4734 [Xylaria hypoxylon]
MCLGFLHGQLSPGTRLHHAAGKMSFGRGKILVCFAALLSVVIANNGGRNINGLTPQARATLDKRNCSSSSPIHETKGGITRHLGISRPENFNTVWTWWLDSDGSLSWIDLGSKAGWQTYDSLSFITAPAFLKRLGLHEWRDLGGRFAYRPTSVSGTTGLSGIFGVNDKGELLYSTLDNQYFVPLTWSDWALLGTGFTGEVAAASSSPGYFELVGIANGTYKQGYTEYQGGVPQWIDLGVPPNSIELGWPKIIAIPKSGAGGNQRGLIDVVVVTDGVVWHKYYDGALWTEEWTRLPRTHDGLEITNSQELLFGDGSSIASNGYIFSRGSDSCVYQNQFGYVGYNETTGQRYNDWLGWNNLWCPEGDSLVPTDSRQSPLSIAAISLYDNRFDLVVETPRGTLEHSQFYHNNGTFEGVVPNWVAVEGPP